MNLQEETRMKCTIVFIKQNVQLKQRGRCILNLLLKCCHIAYIICAREYLILPGKISDTPHQSIVEMMPQKHITNPKY